MQVKATAREPDLTPTAESGSNGDHAIGHPKRMLASAAHEGRVFYVSLCRLWWLGCCHQSNPSEGFLSFVYLSCPSLPSLEPFSSGYVRMYHYWARILCYLNLRDIFRALSSTARIPINRLRESASKCITWCFSSLMPVSRGCFSFFFQGPFLYLSYWRSVLPWGPFIQLRMKIFLLTHTASTMPYI